MVFSIGSLNTNLVKKRINKKIIVFFMVCLLLVITTVGANAIGGAGAKQATIGTANTTVTINVGVANAYAYIEVYNLSSSDTIFYNWKNETASSTGANGETPIPPGAGYRTPYPISANSSGIITFKAIVESGGSASLSNQLGVVW